MPDDPRDTAERPATIDATFRNGSLTAISVVVGFSLTFLNRWAALPGAWHPADLLAVAVIVVGIVLQITTLGRLLWPGSLVLASYLVSVRAFLVGLGLVGLGVLLAIGGDIVGFGQRILGG